MASIIGITYDNQGPTAASDAIFYNVIMTDGVLRGCSVSFVGTKATIAAGYMVSAGRICHFPADYVVTVPAKAGVARIVLQTDLSKTSTADEFEQLSVVVQTASAVSSLPTLVQEDINSGGLIYQQAICTLNTTASGIQSIKKTSPKARLNLASVKIGNANFDGSEDITLDDMGAAMLDSDGKVSAQETVSTLVGITGNTTLGAAHNGKFLRASSSAAITIAVEASSDVPIEGEVEILRYGAGDVIIQAGSTVGLRGVGSTTLGEKYKITDRYAVAVLKRIGDVTWILSGAVEKA